VTQYDSLVERLEARGILQLGIDSTGAPPAPVSDLVLSVSIDRAAVGTADFEEFARILGLDPQALTDRVVAAAGGGGGRDIASKQTFALLGTAYALQAGDVPPVATILTLPTAR